MELCTAAPLLDDKGILITPGWARYPYWEYNRKKAGLRVALKEWDSYTITDEGKGFSFQIIYSDLGYSGIFSIAFFDHIRKKASEVHGIKLFPKQRTLSENPGADSAVTYADSSMTIAFVRKGLKHQILITAPYLMLPDGSTGFKADAVLYEDEGAESMNTATALDNEGRYWHYGRRINPMKAEGMIFINHLAHNLTKDKSHGIMEWERGRWPVKSGWIAATASGWTYDGIAWGVNLSCPFPECGNTESNCIFFDGRIHKLGRISFSHPGNVPMNYEVADGEGRIRLAFARGASLDSLISMKMMKAERKQTAGLFSGFFILDDGRRLEIENAYGSITETRNRW